MSTQKVFATITLLAAFGLMACGDDSSSSSIEKNTDPSPTDPVKCVFKEADKGLSFTKTVTIKNENSGEVDTIEIKGSCIKETCSITTYAKGRLDSNTTLDFDKNEESTKYYQDNFKAQKDNHKEDCDQIDGKTRKNYEDYVALMESISCTIDDSTETHYKHTLTKDGKDGVTEYTLDGTTITINLVEPIASKDDSRCPEKDDIQNDEKQVTCDDNFITTKSKVEAKDEDDAKSKFEKLIKGSYGACKTFIK